VPYATQSTVLLMCRSWLAAATSYGRDYRSGSMAYLQHRLCITAVRGVRNRSRLAA
jgi:hypothetical protein